MKRVAKVLYLSPFFLGASLALANDSPAAVAPDNTKMNERDRKETAVTPMDQAKGSKSDVKLTQRVRKELMKREDLSVDAKNVKIITLDGIVTLRGPVKSDEEKQKVAACAQEIAGVTNVKNELEVASF